MEEAGKTLLRGGVFVLNKPKGVPSRVFGMNFAKAFLKAQTKYELDVEALFVKQNRLKVGHFGTLDPFASGILPVAIGNATRFSDHLPLNPKRYRARLKLGKSTDTDDLDGQVVQTASIPKLPDESTLNKLCREKFLGVIKQTPPRYSAIRVNGVRAYELARRDEEFEIPEREVQIHSISCEIDPIQPDIINFDVTCGSGTYIRTLGCDLAKELGTVGHLEALQRMQSGRFTMDTIGFYSTEMILASFFKPIHTDVPFEIARETVQDGKTWGILLKSNSRRKGKFGYIQPGKYSLYSREKIPLALVELVRELDPVSNRMRVFYKYLMTLVSHRTPTRQ